MFRAVALAIASLSAAIFRTSAMSKPLARSALPHGAITAGLQPDAGRSLLLTESSADAAQGRAITGAAGRADFGANLGDDSVFFSGEPSIVNRSTAQWLRPVAGKVIRGFIQPPGPFAAGHRGLDLAASPGTAVVASARGRVVFAGEVAGVVHVVIQHPGKLWRTGYSFLQSSAVKTGDLVLAGQVIGTSGPAERHAVQPVLHFSLRIGLEYVDPMVLWPMAFWNAPDLTKIVHLDRYQP